MIQGGELRYLRELVARSRRGVELPRCVGARRMLHPHVPAPLALALMCTRPYLQAPLAFTGGTIRVEG